MKSYANKFEILDEMDDFWENAIYQTDAKKKV